MDFVVMLIGSVVGGLILYAVIAAITTEPGRSLQRKFVALGDLRGRTKEEIISHVGPAQSIANIGEKTVLLQWLATGYHISLVFEGGICQGIQSETGGAVTSGEQSPPNQSNSGPPKNTYNPNVEDICHAAGKMVGRTRKIGRTKKSRNQAPPTTTTGEMRCGVCGNPMTFPIADVGKPSECSKCGELLRLRNEA